MSESANQLNRRHAGMTGETINHDGGYTHKFIAAKINLTETRRTCSVTALLMETGLGQTTQNESP